MMIGLFLDCSGTTVTCLLEELSEDAAASEDAKCLVGTLLDMEHSQGQAVGNLLSSAIAMDLNFTLGRKYALLLTLALPTVLANEVYQMSFEYPVSNHLGL